MRETPGITYTRSASHITMDSLVVYTQRTRCNALDGQGSDVKYSMEST